MNALEPVASWGSTLGLAYAQAGRIEQAIAMTAVEGLGLLAGRIDNRLRALRLNPASEDPATLAALAERTKDALLPGRTHGQPAVPADRRRARPAAN